MGKIKMNLDNLNKRGISDLVVISLMIVFVIALGFLVFSFVSKTVGEESQKGADRANAQDICREEVRIRINDVKDFGGNFIINIENLKERSLSDFLVRYELGDQVEIKKARQFLGAYENANIPVEKSSFGPDTIKVIPQIVLVDDELQTSDQGWWLCSGQIAEWSL